MRLAIALLFLCASTSHAAGIAPVASWEVTTRTRTLRGCPLKRVITTPEGWARVTADLDGAPPAPSFDGNVVLLVVADVTGGATSWLDPQLALQPSGDLRVRLWRREPERGVDPSADPALKVFLLLVPAFPGGVRLDHRTVLEGGDGREGSGTIDRPSLPDPADRDPARLPELGPDLTFTYAMADGSPAPPAIHLRVESSLAQAGRVTALPARAADFPAAGITAPYPRFSRAALTYRYAGHDDALRCTNPLDLRALPPDGPDGNPPRQRHRFLLEPIR